LSVISIYIIVWPTSGKKTCSTVVVLYCSTQFQIIENCTSQIWFIQFSKKG